MRSIPSISFDVNHLTLLPGLYVPAVDEVGATSVKTIDIRLCRPYADPVLTGEIAHTLEHVLATGLRRVDSGKIKVLYFGPMGCMTGFYLLLAGNFSDREAGSFIAEGTKIAAALPDVPAKNRRQCGNCETLRTMADVRPMLDRILKMAEKVVGSGTFDRYPD
ncbi:MAG: S-ribosylhomocysteine lyase [Victivallaceae bacterium]|nr:S-ribosylhomocysteine lyase [Victivallaceae bacterium]